MKSRVLVPENLTLTVSAVARDLDFIRGELADMMQDLSDRDCFDEPDLVSWEFSDGEIAGDE